MSSIKLKEGNCIEDGCSYFGRLIAKRCQSHYWQNRQKVKKTSPAKVLKTSLDEKRKKELGVFFAKQILQIPEHCEECGTNLGGWKHFNAKAIIAHILPKRKTFGFPSVATHPMNRMFFCVPCHTDFDNKGSDHVKKMKSLKIIKERLQEFYSELTEEEQNRVPEHFIK